MDKEEMQTTIEFQERQLDDIRKLIEAEMAVKNTSITPIYHRRTELRDNIYEVLER